MRINLVLMVLASVTFACATGKLLCSEELFNGLGGSLPGPRSPSEYSKCVQGAVHTVPCPNGHIFDEHTKQCLFDSTAQEARMETSFQFEELCNNPNAVEIFPNPTNCSQYIICYGLVPIEQSCVNGLLFNPQLNTCDIPSNVICGYSCPAVDDPYNPVWLPDSRLEDCSRHYLCFQGNPLQFYCYNNLYFDIVSRTCTYPQYSACSVPDVYCSSNITVNIANPRSCTSYYICEDGFPHFRNCDYEEYFSEALGVCIPGTCETGTTTTAGSTTFEPSSTTVSSETTPSLTSTTDLNTPTGDLTSTTPSLTTPELTSPDSTTVDFTTEFTTPDTSSTPAVSPTTPETTSEFVTESTQELSTTTSFESTTAIETTTFPTEPESTTFGPTTPELTTSGETTTPDIPSTAVTTPETTSEFITDSTSTSLSTQELSTTTTSFESTTAIETTTFPTEPESTTFGPTTPELTTNGETTTPDIPSTAVTTPETTSEIITESTSIETSTSLSTEDVSTTTTSFETSTSEITETTTVELTTASTDSTTTAEPETTATTEMVTIDPNEVCAGLGITILPYPGNCIMYILCINGIGGVSTCAAGEIFNVASSTCVPGNQETCTLT